MMVVGEMANLLAVQVFAMPSAAKLVIHVDTSKVRWMRASSIHSSNLNSTHPGWSDPRRLLRSASI